MKQRLAWTALLAASLFGVAGLLHMPFARTLLARIGGCPFPVAEAAPSQAEADAARVRAARGERGAERAQEKPALGFSLGDSTREDVHAWAARVHARCAHDAVGLGMRCEGVRLDALPGGRAPSPTRAQVAFGFDLDGKLVSASFLARVTSPDEAERVRSDAERELALSGPPTRTEGRGVTRAFERRVDAWAYSDYLGEVVTTHLGSGVVVAARHMEIPD